MEPGVIGFARSLAALTATVAAFVLIEAGLATAATFPTGFHAVTLATGLTRPTAVAWTPDGRLLIAEQEGKLLESDGSGPPQLLLDISDHVNSYLDRGLLGIAVDPDFAFTGAIYLLYTYEDAPANPTGPKVSRLTRVVMDKRGQIVGGMQTPVETVLLGHVSTAPCPAAANSIDCIPSDGASHSIGSVRAAADGTLWVGSGEGSGFKGVDPLAFRSLDEASFGGKILHVDRNGDGLPGHPFCPADNTLTDACTKVYAEGLRNPYRFSATGSAPGVIGDVGWNSWEELDLLTSGADYGWPCWEGPAQTFGYSSDPRCSDPVTGLYAQATAKPLYAFDHSRAGPQGIAVIGGPTYTGPTYPPGYAGTIFFGAFGAGFIERLALDHNRQVTAVDQFAAGIPGLVDLELDPGSGELIYVDRGDGTTGAGSVALVTYPAGHPSPGAAAGSTSARPLEAAPLGVVGVGSPTSSASGPHIHVDPGPGHPHRRLVLSGWATDPLGVREVDVAVDAGPPLKSMCRWLGPGRRARRMVRGACARPRWIPAALSAPGRESTRWGVTLNRRLRPGPYNLYFRAVDEPGNATYRVDQGATRLTLRIAPRRR